METEIVPDCDTYKFFKRRREGLTQLAEDLSQSWNPDRTTVNKRGTETKKVLKVMLAVEEESA